MNGTYAATAANPSLRLLLTGLLAAILAGIAPAGVSAQSGSDLQALREEALSLVNEARRRENLQPLSGDGALQRAAQSHAEDMLRRGYYAHESPEGETVADRFRAAGGSQWKLTAENIARCEGCPTDPSAERVRQFQRGWMDSPSHRANILRDGLDSFGFGIAGGKGKVYAVQTFAGAGAPRSGGSGGAADAISPAAATREALDAINAERQSSRLDPLARSEALGAVAEKLLAGAPDEPGGGIIARPGNLLDLLPQGETRQWRRLDVLAAACGGCGTVRTAADARDFVRRWLDDSGYRSRLLGSDYSHAGFFLRADGDGRKRAVAVLGQQFE